VGASAGPHPLQPLHFILNLETYLQEDCSIVRTSSNTHSELNARQPRFLQCERHRSRPKAAHLPNQESSWVSDPRGGQDHKLVVINFNNSTSELWYFEIGVLMTVRGGFPYAFVPQSS